MKLQCATLFAAALLAVVPAFVGCGEKLPEGMPKLTPVTIKVTQEGKPVADATVNLFPQSEENKKWSCGGTTDATGTLVVMTNGKYKGMPAGQYQATVLKTVAENLPKSSADPPADVYYLTDKKFEEVATSGLSFDSATEKNVEFELGPAVKIKK